MSDAFDAWVRIAGVPRETGRPQAIEPRDPTRIAPPEGSGLAPERDVPRPEPSTEELPSSQQLPDDTLDELGLARRTHDLVACRTDVASKRAVRPSRVMAGAVRIHFTLGAGGSVTDVETVAVGKTDPDLLLCIRDRVRDWVFVRSWDAPDVPMALTLGFDER